MEDGGIRCYMAVYAGIWRYMEVYAGIWRYMKVYGDMYIYVYASIWKYMEVYDGIWRCPGRCVSGAFEVRTAAVVELWGVPGAPAGALAAAGELMPSELYHQGGIRINLVKLRVNNYVPGTMTLYQLIYVRQFVNQNRFSDLFCIHVECQKLFLVLADRFEQWNVSVFGGHGVHDFLGRFGRTTEPRILCCHLSFTHSPCLAICVPFMILVISKTVRKSKHTISKTIIWAQSWICVEIKDLDLHIFEIISKSMDLDLQIKDFDVQIYDFWNNLKNLEVQTR